MTLLFWAGMLGGMAVSTESSSSTAPIDLAVSLAGIALKNPIMTASGTSGYGAEYAPYADLTRLGAFVTKSITPEVRKGNPTPRTVETACGMLNAIGLANVGLERFITEKVPFLQDLGIPVIVNVAGHNLEDYLNVCRRLDDVPCISALELNVSCPNVADGLEFGTSASRLYHLVSAARRTVRRAKLVVKLSPNVTDITETAKAAVEAGSDALSCINTLQGMAISVERRRPILANKFGGLSGPAIKPVALAMIYKVYRDVCRSAGVPIIGMGGIRGWRDVVEFMLAGATAVAIGTISFIDPTTLTRVIDDLAEYLRRQNLQRIESLIGQAHG